jgi:hypothetical protein
MTRITSHQITDELYPAKDELLALIENEGETSLARYFTGYERAARRYLRRHAYDPSKQTVEAFFDDLCRHMAVVAADAQNREERLAERRRRIRRELRRWKMWLYRRILRQPAPVIGFLEVLNLYPSADELERLVREEGEVALARYFPGYEADAREFISQESGRHKSVAKLFSRIIYLISLESWATETGSRWRINLRFALAGWQSAIRYWFYRHVALRRKSLECPAQCPAQLESIAESLRQAGYTALVNQASTGSLYLHAWNDEVEFKVRLSDHPMAHDSGDIAADCRTIAEVRSAVERLLSSRRAKVLDG